MTFRVLLAGWRLVTFFMFRFNTRKIGGCSYEDSDVDRNAQRIVAPYLTSCVDLEAFKIIQHLDEDGMLLNKAGSIDIHADSGRYGIEYGKGFP